MVLLRFQKGGEGLYFPCGRLTVQGNVVGGGKAGLIRRRFFVLKEAGRKSAGGFDEGGIIQQRERLLRGVAVDPGSGALIPGRRIEVREHGMEEGALPVRVDTATPLPRVGVSDIVPVRELERLVIAGRLVGFHTGAADALEVQQTGDGEGIVPHELGLETTRVLRREEAIGRVGILEFGSQIAALTIGLARDDEPHHVLQVPARLAKLDREPIEQFRVRGQFPLRTEVVNHGAQPVPEEHRPKPVHDRAGGDGIGVRNDPVGEIETSESLFRRALETTGEERGRRRQDDRTGLVEPVSARQDTDLERLVGGERDHRPGLAAAELALFRRQLMSGIVSGSIRCGAEEEGGIGEKSGFRVTSGGVNGQSLQCFRVSRLERIKRGERTKRELHREKVVSGEGGDNLVPFVQLHRGTHDPDRAERFFLRKNVGETPFALDSDDFLAAAEDGTPGACLGMADGELFHGTLGVANREGKGQRLARTIREGFSVEFTGFDSDLNRRESG